MTEYECPSDTELKEKLIKEENQSLSDKKVKYPAIYHYKEEDLKQAIKELKEVHKVWSDNSMFCPVCDKGKRVWVKDKNHCYDCEIDKIFGDKLTK